MEKIIDKTEKHYAIREHTFSVDGFNKPSEEMILIVNSIHKGYDEGTISKQNFIFFHDNFRNIIESENVIVVMMSEDNTEIIVIEFDKKNDGETYDCFYDKLNELYFAIKTKNKKGDK